MNRRLEIKKGLLGGYSIGYDCPRCSSPLKSPLDDAGTSDTCPNCGRGFIVPGKEEHDRIRGKQELEERRRCTETEQLEQNRRLKLAKEEAERKRAAEEEQRCVDATVEHEPAHAPFNVVKTRLCPYCAEEILANAKKCKHCGEFLDLELKESRSGRQATTIEQTGKRWKGLQVTSVLGIIVASTWFFIEIQLNGSGAIPFFIGFASFCAYVYARVGAWWHHG